MFHGLTAWFSSSVSKCKKKLWLDNGGKVAKLGEAVYLFSQDENNTDTLGIFESDAYINEQLSVFHASYIKECVKFGNIHKGVLGKYFLPPKDIQEIGKNQKEYEWYRDGNLPDAAIPDLEPDDKPLDHQQNDQSAQTNTHQSETTRGILQSSSNTRYPSAPKTEYLMIQDLAKIKGDLNDFVVGRNGCDLIDLSDS